MFRWHRLFAKSKKGNSGDEKNSTLSVDGYLCTTSSFVLRVE